MVTMSDVARLAGVSQTTVSHVLNKSRAVLPATEQAVLDAIEATGYATDHVARSLRKGATGIVGLAMSAISNPYFGDIVHAIEERATAAGFSILLVETHSDPAIERTAVGHLVSQRVDAVILAASEDPSRSLAVLSSNAIPTVLVDRIPPGLRDGFDSVGVINTEPTAQLVDHLVGHGHRNIAMVSGRRGLATTEERVAGFLEGCERNNLPEADLRIVSGYGIDGATDLDLIRELLTTPTRPSALVIGNNQTTISVMTVLRQLKLEVPRGIALVAFDDFPWSDLFHPRMTVMAQPVEDIGAQAVRMLTERLGNGLLPSRSRRFEPKLVLRESCGCAH